MKRKRKGEDGLLIFFDSISRQVVWHKFIESETKENYLEGLKYIQEKVFEIQLVVIKRRPGIPDVFKKYLCLEVSILYSQLRLLQFVCLNF